MYRSLDVLEGKGVKENVLLLQAFDGAKALTGKDEGDDGNTLVQREERDEGLCSSKGRAQLDLIEDFTEDQG